MKYAIWFLAVVSCWLVGERAWGDSIWERRNAYTSYLFRDTVARRVGDVLTIVVRETTQFQGMEDRKMNKETKTGSKFGLKLNTATGAGTKRSFEGNWDGLSSSQRKLDGKADYMSNRTFTDRMSVVVTEVLPNGNLVIEGYRQRRIAHEEKTIRVTGIVRPIDIGPDNIVQSQFIANFNAQYTGQGAESSYLNNGWLGRIVNTLWPY